MKIKDLFKKKDTETLDIKQYSKAPSKKKKASYRSIVIEPGSTIEPEAYYNSRSTAFGYAKHIVTVLLIGLIIVAFTFLSDIFTAENFKYLIKHININISGVSEDYRTLVYSSSDKNAYGDLRRDFVIASPGALKIYDYNGAVSLNSTLSTDNPKISTSSEYILLYDRGDRDFYIYNNFSQLFSGECSGKIISGDISREGVFALVADSIEYSAHIYVYNENFELIREIKKKDPVTKVCLSKDGELLAIMTTALKDAEYVSTLTVYDIKNNTDVIRENIYSEVCLDAYFDENSKDIALTVLTDKGLHRYSNFGEEAVLGYEDENVSIFDMSEKYTAYVVRTRIISDDCVFYMVDNKTMKRVHLESFDDKILDVKICGENAYILTSSSIMRIGSDGKVKTQKLENHPDGMVIFSTGEAFVRYSGFAEYVIFS